MGHHIQGLVGRPELLLAIAARHRLEAPVALRAGLAFLPLDDENLDDFVGLDAGPTCEGFCYLSPKLQELVRRLSEEGGALAYVETDYFGGAGGQGALLCRDGVAVLGPIWSEQEPGPISQALAGLGVTAGPQVHDAFEEAGLGALRSNEHARERPRLA